MQGRSEVSCLFVGSTVVSMDPKVLDCLRRGNPVVFFDISIGGSPSGRIRLELFKNICPKVELCVVLFTL